MRPDFTVILIVLLPLFFSTGCDSPSSSVFPNHLMINYTARNHGALFPCGCRIPIGGLSRRGGVLMQDSPYPQLTVDAGNFVGGNTGYDRFTGDYILRASMEMGYHAINIGQTESIQTIDQLKAWDELTGGLLVSANIVDSNGDPVTRSFIIEEIGGIKIGITGASTDRNIPEAAIGLPDRIDPVAPLQAVIESLNNENVDFVILLTDCLSFEVSKILNANPGIDLVIQAAEFVPSRDPEVYMPVGSTRLVNMGGSGKYLGRLRLDFEPDGVIRGEEVMCIDLDSFVPTMSSISILMTEFKTELQGRRSEFLGDPANPFQRTQSPELIDVLTGYTGSAFCDRCHGGYGYESRVTGHDSAWDLLDDVSNVDPACLACHTTGFGIPTGLEDPFRDSHLAAVTCEACHGPAALHVREMTAIKEGLDTTNMLDYVNPTSLPFTRIVPAETCLRCHTPEWSPDFDYDTWVELVKHEAAENHQPDM